MPNKSKPNAKAGSNSAGTSVGGSKSKSGILSSKVSSTVTPTTPPLKAAAAKAPMKGALKVGASKPPVPKTPLVKSNLVAPKGAAGSAKATSVAAPQKTGTGQRPAAVSTQKSDTVKPQQQQQRTPMATSATAKSAPAVKSSAKGAPAKAAPVKAATQGVKAAVKVAVVAAPAAKLAVAAAQAAAVVKPVPQRAMPSAVAVPAAQRISAPASVATPTVLTPKDIALRALQAQQAAAAKKPVSARHGFKTNEWIVYPAHGVGRIVSIEEQEIAGMSLELFVITFEKDKMTLRVPTGKCASVGMRKLAEDGVVKRAMETLKGKARIKRTMWSRRAQEFEQKINSGDLVSIAEVVRDLFRAETQPEQSYSERQLYEAALDRMAREIAAVEKIDERGAVQRLTEVLAKTAKSRRAEAGEGGVPNGDVKAA
jgi:CarD family transcriptional regulator